MTIPQFPGSPYPAPHTSCGAAYFESFFKLLFDEHDYVRVTSDPKVNGTGILLPCSSLYNANASYMTANAMTGTARNEDSVTKRRTFVIEFDEMSLEEQQKHVASLGLPYSASVFSGNKSIHHLVVLCSPISLSEYKTIAKMISKAVPGVDPSPVQNSAGYTRLPLKRNARTGRIQELLSVNNRIPNDHFLQWLEGGLSKCDYAPSLPRKQKVRKDRGIGEIPFLDPLLSLPPYMFRWLAEEDFPGGQRNKRWFSIGCKCAEMRLSLDETLSCLERYFVEEFGEDGFLYEEWERTIRSAHKHVNL